MDFPTQYTKETKAFTSVTGSPFLDEYEYSLDKEGHKMLVKSENQTNVYEIIQSYKDSCDINILMEKFALGDTEALNVKTGYYLDTRNMPTNIHEVFAMGLEAEQYFEGLPVELKENFDNSASVFFTEMSEDPKVFNKKVNDYNDKFIDHSFDEKTEITEEINYNE